MTQAFIQNPAALGKIRSVTLSDKLTLAPALDGDGNPMMWPKADPSDPDTPMVDGNGDPLNVVSTCKNPHLIGWVHLPDGPPEKQMSEDEKHQALNNFRDGLIVTGRVFEVTAAIKVHLSGGERDQRFLQERKVRAMELKAAGSSKKLVYRDAVNTIHQLTPTQMINLVNMGADWIESLMVVSWMMKDKATPFETGIPDDFENLDYWPV